MARHQYALLTVALVCVGGAMMYFGTERDAVPSSCVAPNTAAPSRTAADIFASELLEILRGSWRSVDLTAYNALTAILPYSLEGGSFQVDAERQVYIRLAQMSHVRRICEIGFNGGHSAALWLMANPHAEVVMFELSSTHPWVVSGVKILRNPTAERFGLRNVSKRLRMVYGSSHVTLRYLARTEALRCDLVSVDGDHTQEGALQDIVDMQALVNPLHHVAVIDDTTCETSFCVDNAFAEALKMNIVRTLLRLNNGTREEQSYINSLGRATPVPQSLRGVTVYRYLF